MKYGLLIVVLALASCGPTNSKQPFTDWSYRTRDRQHNRYDGYDAYHVREEQWQTDPYWTAGEGLDRRKAQRTSEWKNAVEGREAERLKARD